MLYAQHIVTKLLDGTTSSIIHTVNSSLWEGKYAAYMCRGVGWRRRQERNMRSKILEKAKKAICEDRNAQYGEPEDNFANVAQLWSDYMDVDFTPHDVGVMMALLKIGRIKGGARKEDNYIDAAGYIACAGEIGLKPCRGRAEVTD